MASVRSTRQTDLGITRRASAFLLELYAMSRNLAVGHFQPAVLTRLRSELEFSSAWWGMIRVSSDGNLTLHSNFAYSLPDDFAASWEMVKHNDDLATAVTSTPGIAASMAIADLRHKADVARLIERFGIGTALSIAIVNADLNLLTFLSLYRAPGAPSFDDADHCLQEVLMPHLAAAWHANWLRHFELMRVDRETQRAGLAVSDQHGIVHVVDASFAELMRSEWPSWNGSGLPPPLYDAIRNNRRYTGRQVSVNTWRQHDLIVLRARLHTSFDQLSPREAEIARCYRDGLSYKQIAARLTCSPYTVRHHLRAIYDKLGVSNKAALVRLTEEGRKTEHS